MALVNGFPSGSQLRIATYNIGNLPGSDATSKTSPEVPVGESFVPTSATESDFQVTKAQVEPTAPKLDTQMLASQAHGVASSLSGMWG